MKKLLSFILGLFVSSTIYAQTTPNLKNYTGTYQIEGGGGISEVIISIEKGTLYGAAPGQGEASLSATDKPDVFTIDGYGGSAVFMRENGIVVGMLLTLQGQEMKGKRDFPNNTDFVGNYLFENAQIQELIVTAEDNGLYAEVPGLGKTNLETTSNLNEYYESNYGSTLSFVRDNEGKVISVSILSQGNEMLGKKK